MAPQSSFQAYGRTAIITGGSSGMGLCVARQLAEKGASVIIVARDQEKLLKAIQHVKDGALNLQGQRFHHISADLTSSTEAVRLIDEVVSWNLGKAPDIVWCCAGASHPTLFIDTPVSEFSKQMNTNYFTGLYLAHTVLNCWLKSAPGAAIGTPISSSSSSKPATQASQPNQTRHLIFTASLLSLYTFTGYTPYSPGKAALRSLSDTLSQEMNLYAAANPTEPRVRVHTIFPATILTEGLEAENRVKTDVTKLLEEADTPQSPEAVATKSIQGLDMLGGSIRGGFIHGLVDWLLASWIAIIMVFICNDMDKKVQKWGRDFGASNIKPKDS
ncbi:hypothetical protein F4778DRAFT_790180 [Xylariomycetidae sp. FL2044]|nr:hypothetical protein F4778DRAFT_790180 [Xylariomycetidae sp. FL2044]